MTPSDPTAAGPSGPVLATPSPTGKSKFATNATMVALSVAVAHGVNDAYASFLHPLLPRLMDKLGLTIALAAALGVILSIAASLLQPVMGVLADHYGRRAFVALGPLLSGVFLSMLGVAPTFSMLLILLALGGLGSAAFHPPGASMAARVSDGKGSGVRLSFFSFAGAMGFAVGPLTAVWIVNRVGLEGLWMAMLPGVVVAAVVFVILPKDEPQAAHVRLPRPREVLGRLRGPLGLVFGISAVGAFVQRTFVTMEPIIVSAAGKSEAAGALALSVYFAAQGGGTLMSGFLTDRVDRLYLIAVITILAIPAHLLAVLLPPATMPALAAGAAAGFLNMALLPPIVVMAQEMSPEGASTSSGIAMGLAWAVGSMGVLVVGILGDVLGARTAAALAVPTLLLGTFLALRPGLAPYRRAQHF